MRSLLGGKGANVAEMARIGVRVPDGFTVTTEACVETPRRTRRGPRGCGGDPGAPRRPRGAHRPAPRRPGEPAAGLGALRRGVLDAGDDGHDPQPGHRRRRRRGAGALQRQRALRLGLRTAASCRCSARSWSACRPTCSSTRSSRKKSDRGVQNDTDLGADDLRALVAEFRRLVREETGEDFPDDPREQLRRAVDAVFR